MRYNEALAVISIAHTLTREIEAGNLPAPKFAPYQTAEYHDAVTYVGCICETGILAFHAALQRLGKPTTHYSV